MHAEYLLSWLFEWSLHQKICDAERVDDNAGFIEELKSPQLGGMVELSQIRLLYPDCRAAWERPIYAALLDKLDDGNFLAAPFSRFCTPALPGELLTSRPEPQLRVLCVWNSFTMDKERLLTSWHVDTLSEQDIKHALNVRRCLASDCDIPDDLLMRTGPAVLSSQDPRWVYQDEELEIASVMDDAHTPPQSKSIYEINEAPSEYRSLAAERSEDA